MVTRSNEEKLKLIYNYEANDLFKAEWATPVVYLHSDIY